MESVFPELLPFDGSFIGEFDFHQIVSWCWPCRCNRAILFALLGPQKLPVVLKRNTSKRTDQCVIDEMKPLFGLVKMGTHRARLHGVPRRYDPDLDWMVQGYANFYIHPQWSDYFIFQASGKSVNGTVVVTPILTLGETIWSPPTMEEFGPEHWAFYYEIQKVLVVRNLFRVTTKSLKDLLVKRDPIRLVSINETKARDPRTPYSKPDLRIIQVFFPKPCVETEVLTKMLGLTKENHQDRMEDLRTGMNRVVERVDSEKFWLVESVLDQINDKISIYFSLTA